MSVEPSSGLARVRLSCLFLYFFLGGLGSLLLDCQASQAWNSSVQFKDPLTVIPDRMQRKLSLPGDSYPVSCPVLKDFSEPLSLAEAVDIALCNNPRVRVAWATIKLQTGALGEANAAYLPVMSGTLGTTRDQIRYTDGDEPSSTTNQLTMQSTLSWRLLDFGERMANRQAAEHLLNAAMASHDATVQQVLSETVQAYGEALSYQAKREAKDTGVQIATQTLRIAQILEAKGGGSATDILQATTAQAKAVLEWNRAEGEEAKAVSLLRYTLGLSGSQRLVLPQHLEIKAGSAVDAGAQLLDDWMEEAERRHPAILAARSQLKAAQEQLNAARTSGLPTLGLAASYYRNTGPGGGITSSEAQENTVGLVLNVPLFDGFASTYKRGGAEAQVERQEAILANTIQQIAMEVVNAHADALAAWGNLKASAALLQAAQQSLSLVQRRYSKGAAAIVDLLNSQAELAVARQERIRCLAEWRSARLRLLASTGRMHRQAIGREQ